MNNNPKSITKKCAKCNKPFRTNNEEHTLCKECFEKRNEIVETITCKDCGQEFHLTAGEKEYFDKLGFTSPVRCPACRKARKNKAAKAKANA